MNMHKKGGKACTRVGYQSNSFVAYILDQSYFISNSIKKSSGKTCNLIVMEHLLSDLMKHMIEKIV